MITPDGSVLTPGSAIVAYQSDWSAGHVRLTRAGAAAIELSPIEIAPHVVRLPLPASAAAGTYAVSARWGEPGHRQRAAMGTIRIAASAPASAPLTIAGGHLRHRTTPGRWAPNEATIYALATPASAPGALVAVWTDHGATYASVAWIARGDTEVTLTSHGSCGGFPHATTGHVPAHGAHVRLATIDPLGVVGAFAEVSLE